MRQVVKEDKEARRAARIDAREQLRAQAARARHAATRPRAEPPPLQGACFSKCSCEVPTLW